MKLLEIIAFCTMCCLFVLCAHAAPVSAGTDPSLLANAMSATLDLWRENGTGQLYDRLGNRGNTTKDQFVEKLGTSIRPACCWQKLDNFKVMNENGTEATVIAKIGIEVTYYKFSETFGSISSSLTTVEYITCEFKLNYEGGIWKMHLNDVFSLQNAARESRSQREPGSR
jgi:hypothetical protein